MTLAKSRSRAKLGPPDGIKTVKTGSLSLIALCGVVWGFIPLPLAGQKADAQPAKSAPAEVKSDSANSNKGAKANRRSAGLDDVVELAKAGVDQSVILAFIQSSPVAYHPSAQEVIELRELGVSTPLITALLSRGVEVRQHAAPAQQGAQPSAPAPAANYQPPPPAVPTVQPAGVDYAPPVTSPTVVYAIYPRYSYSTMAWYGYGGYDDCYYPRYYSCYPRVSYYGAFYPRFSFGVRFGGIHFGGFHARFGGGIRHCR